MPNTCFVSSPRSFAGKCPFFTRLTPEAQRGQVTCPQPHSSDGAGRTQNWFPNPPHPMTPRCLPLDKSCPNNPVLQGHTSHFFRESALGPSCSCKVKGAARLLAHALEVKSCDVGQAAVPGLDRLFQNSTDGQGKCRVLLDGPTPGAHALSHWPCVGCKPRATESPRPSSRTESSPW